MWKMRAPLRHAFSGISAHQVTQRSKHLHPRRFPRLETRSRRPRTPIAGESSSNAQGKALHLAPLLVQRGRIVHQHGRQHGLRALRGVRARAPGGDGRDVATEGALDRVGAKGVFQHDVASAAHHLAHVVGARGVVEPAAQRALHLRRAAGVDQRHAAARVAASQLRGRVVGGGGDDRDVRAARASHVLGTLDEGERGGG